MSAPKFSKEFNVDHAKAGAPYCCRDGTKVEILKWDRKHPLCIIGELDIPPLDVMGWNAGGTNNADEAFHLVMLPLGMIDGKPVFVGDEVEYESFAGWGRAVVSADWRAFEKCRWPAPAKVYPVFTGSLDLLAIEYNDANGNSGIQAIANAALRHAIDAGQVAPINEVVNGCNKAAELRDARDMAIAKRVWQSCAGIAGGTHLAIVNMDLAAIIAQVKP